MPEESAIQKDVLPNAETHIGARGHNRLEYMNQISESNHEQLAEDAGVTVEEIRGQDAPVEDPKEEIVDDVPPKEESQVSRALADDDSFVSIQINGGEEDVPVSTLKRSYQKDVAGDRKLEDAANRNKELDEREEKIAARETALEVKPDEAEPKLSREDAKAQFTAAIYDGEEGKINEAIDVLMPEEQEAKPSEPVNITEEVASGIEKKFDEMAFNKAAQAFKTDYPDIVNDTQLARQADGFLGDILKENPGMTEAEALPLAGERTQKWVNDLKGPTEPEEVKPTEREKKKARKAATVDNLQSSGDKAITTVEDDKPLTNSETIAEMRKQRALPAY
jgi:hypothetical protein